MGGMFFVSLIFLAGNLTYFVISTRLGRKKLMLISILPLGFCILAIEIMALVN